MTDTNYSGLNAAANTELNRIENETERARLARAVLDSGIAGTARIYFIRALRHKLGHRARRGDTVISLPTPPAGLKPVELQIIDTRVADAAHAMRLEATPAGATKPPPIPPERIEAAQRDRGRSWGEA